MSPPAEAVSAANRLAEVVEQLRGDLHEATESFEKSRQAFEASSSRLDTASRRQRWFLILIAAVLILVGWLTVSNRVTAHHVAQQTAAAQRQAACVRAYANQNSDRATVLQPLLNARSDALDALIRTLPHASSVTPAQEKARFTAALFGYLKASDTYSAAVQSNPLPLPPKFTC